MDPMDEILNRVELAVRSYPIRVQDKDWGEIEYRFDLPAQGASDRDLEKVRSAIGLQLPASLAVLLRRWNGLRLLQIWIPDDPPPREEIRFYSTELLAQIGWAAVQELDDAGRKGIVVANGYGCGLLMEPEREWVIICQESVGRYFYLCDTLAGFLEMALRTGPTRKPPWADESSWRNPI
jgi:hypothetical protein